MGADDYVWRVGDLLDFRHSLVDRMENTEKLLKKFNPVEQRWLTEDIWEDDGPGLDEGEVVERLRMLEEIRSGRERIKSSKEMHVNLMGVMMEAKTTKKMRKR